MKCLAIIPARYESTRFPGKPLAMIGDRTMIRRVYEQLSTCPAIDRSIVATDDKRILEEVRSFGGEVEMTAHHHQNGTQRSAEVAGRHPSFDLILNVQGDEPFIKPEQLAKIIEFLQSRPEFSIASMKKKITNTDEITDPNVVKVISDLSGKAIYFSRQAIPYLRSGQAGSGAGNFPYYKHIGLYAFRRQTLLEVVELPPGLLETAESLEQLRWLENGYDIGLIETSQETIGIDLPSDLDKIRHLL